jgi:methionine aminopeptidase
MTERIEALGKFFFPNLISGGSCASHYTCRIKELKSVNKDRNLSIDFGLIYKDLIPVDTAFTMTFNKPEVQIISMMCDIQKMIPKVVNKFVNISQITEFVEQVIRPQFQIASDLCGHTLTVNSIHEDILIPSSKIEGITQNCLKTIEVGQFFTIEPFIAHRPQWADRTFNCDEGPSEEHELIATVTPEGWKKPNSLRRLVRKNIRLSDDELQSLEVYPPLYHEFERDVFHFEDTYFMSETGPIIVSSDYSILEPCIMRE